MPPDEDIASALAAAGAVAGWLFGSAANGRARPDSDLDVGILFGRAASLEERMRCRRRLQLELGFEKIDLVALDDASPILRFAAVCGRRVYCADDERCAAFVSLTAREYEDELAQAERWLT